MLVMVWKWIQQLPTKDNNMQQGVPMHPTCNIQQCWGVVGQRNVHRPFAWGFMVQFYPWFKLYFPLFQVHKHTSPKLYFVLI